MIGTKEIAGLIALMIVTFLIFISPIGGKIVDSLTAMTSAETGVSPEHNSPNSVAMMADNQRANFTFCDRAPRVNCIIDGDTFWYQSRKIRIADINAPETGNPLCVREAALGQQSAVRLHQLLNAGDFSMGSADRDEDRYGRDLRIIYRQGQSLGDILVSEGLAHKWHGRKESWCG